MEQNQNELYHFGVKGMKWGVVKSAVKAGVKSGLKNAGTSAVGSKLGQKIGEKMSKGDHGWNKDTKKNLKIDKKVSKKVKNINSDYTKAQIRQDYSSFKARGVKRINNRMNKGKTHNQAVNREIGRQAAKEIISSIGSQLIVTAAASYIAIKGKQYANRNLPRLEYNVIDLASDAFKVID